MAEFKNEIILQVVDSSGAVTKSVAVDLRNALVLTSAPTTATAARVGMQAYVVSGSTVQSEYVCVAAENGVYTWVHRVVESSGGGTGGGSGADGFSPIATVDQTETGAIITITDKNGTTTATVSNGAKGDPGDDYILTEADKTEIAEEAADIVDDALSEVIGDPDGAVPAVPGYMALGMTGAAVGMVARVKSVDADGKPTSWEPVEMGSGGGSGGSLEWRLIGEVTTEEELTSIQLDIPDSIVEVMAHIVVPGSENLTGQIMAGAWETTVTGSIDANGPRITIGNITKTTLRALTHHIRLNDVRVQTLCVFGQYPAKYQSYSTPEPYHVASNKFIVCGPYMNVTMPAGISVKLYGR